MPARIKPVTFGRPIFFATSPLIKPRKMIKPNINIPVMDKYYQYPGK
jgi:hypothetical protein